MGRATCRTPAPGSACSAQTCSVRVASPAVPLPLQWGGAWSAPHAQPMQILGGVMGLDTLLPTAMGKPGQAAGDGVTISHRLQCGRPEPR